MGFFKLKSKVNLREANLNDVFQESDYATITKDDHFMQWDYVEDQEEKPYIVKPGVFSIEKTQAGLELHPTTFTKEEILHEFINTKEIEDVIDCFMENIPLYKEFGYEVAKRGVLLYGPQGTGKSTAIKQVVEKYSKDDKTAIIVWHTAKWESYVVKDFIKRFSYEGVEKLILVAEDLGGEGMDGARKSSDASLLSLLDNQEKTFKLATLIIATTNYPEMFMGNITNRAGRFDDKIEVGFPGTEERKKLLAFFSKGTATDEALNLIGSKNCAKFPPASIKEAYIRSRLRNKELTAIIEDMIKEHQLYEKGFQKREDKMGF